MKTKAETPIMKKLSSLHTLISHPYTFVFILVIIFLWFIQGSFMHFDEKWHDIFILSDAIITLLMVFIIESTQQADNRAVQEKLDEIIKSLPQASNKKIGLEKHYKGEKPAPNP